MIEEFLQHWNAEDLVVSPGTKKLAYRVIAGRKYQFKMLGFKQRTALLIEAAGVLANVSEIYDATRLLSEDLDDTQVLAAMFPVIVKVLTNEKLQPVIERLCNTASVDLGAGKFDPLEDEFIGEQAFGDDLTLQIPVALTAAIFNFEKLIPLAAKVL